MTVPVPDAWPGPAEDPTAAYPAGGSGWRASSAAGPPVAPTAAYPGTLAASGAGEVAGTGPYVTPPPLPQPVAQELVQLPAGPGWWGGPTAAPAAAGRPASGSGPVPPGAGPVPPGAGPVPPGPGVGQVPGVWVPQPVLCPPVDPRATSHDWMGVISLVLGIVAAVSFGYLAILTIPGVILGHMGRAAARRGQASNPGLALGGLVVNWVLIGLLAAGVVASVVLLAAFLESMPSMT